MATVEGSFGFTTFYSSVSEFFMHTGQKAGIHDETPHNNIYPARTDKWPTTESSDFHLSFLFFFTYLLGAAGNLTITSPIFIDCHLRTAMYFFLQNFSFLEISFTTACILRFLYNISAGDKIITYDTCEVQILFTYLLGITEFLILATVPFDRYVAICKPRHYVTIMNNRVCNWLIISFWMPAMFITIPPLSLGLNLEFCDSDVIDHFFCAATFLLKISCSDTLYIERMILVYAVLTFVMNLVCAVLSSIYIILTILKQKYFLHRLPTWLWFPSLW